MMSLTLRFILDEAIKQWLTGRKIGEDGIPILKYLENETSFLDEIKKTLFIVFEGLSFGEKIKI